MIKRLHNISYYFNLTLGNNSCEEKYCCTILYIE